MKVYLLIKPWDYFFAEVEAFRDIESAKKAKEEGKINKEKNHENWTIQSQEI